MAKPTDRDAPGRQYPHMQPAAPDQPDVYRAVGDDLPKTPAVEDTTQPAPGRKKAGAKSRSKQEEQ